MSSLPVNTSSSSLRRRLEAYYGIVCPSVVEDCESWADRFTEIYEKYGGSAASEAKLQKRLMKKYGSDVILNVVMMPSSATIRTHTSESAISARIAPLSGRDIADDHLLPHTPDNPGTGDTCFTSTSFDAYAALYSPDYALNLKSPMVLDAVERCRCLLPVTDPDHIASRQRHDRQQQGKSSDPSKINKRKYESPLVNLATALKDGPLSILERAMRLRKKIRITTRYVNSIRGDIVGQVKGFDRHMNIILGPGSMERYWPRHITTAASPDNTGVEQERRKSLFKTRRIKDTMVIRGDMVVVVSIVSTVR